MRKILVTASFLYSLLFVSQVFGQSFTISGKVVDELKEPLIGVNIFIPREKVHGTTTDFDGNFTIDVVKGDSLIFRYVGYIEQTISITTESQVLNVELVPENYILNTVVISASRKKEKILDAPASISVVEPEALKSKVAVGLADHIKDLGGVNIMKTSITGGNPSVRGFNGYMNGDLMTLIDNRMAGLPSLRLNFYNLVPAVDDDIERVELLRGPASALYGPNTSNGVVHIITKSPINEQSTKVWISMGVRTKINDTLPTVDTKSPRFDNDIKGRTMGEIGFRHAGLIPTPDKDKFQVGYKLSGKFFQGQDWKYDDPNDPAKIIRFRNTPNGPVELHSNGVMLSQEEIDKGKRGDSVLNIRDETITKVGLDARLDFRFKNKFDLNIAGGYNLSNGIDMSPIGALQTKRWQYAYFQARFMWKELFVQTYVNSNNSGSTFFIPTGGAFVDLSKFSAVQLQHNVEPLNNLNLTYGIDGFFTRPNTDYTLNGSFEDNDNINEFGGYFQADYQIIPRLTLLLASRLDYHNQIKKPFVSPRAALVYKPGTGQNIRMTFNRAFRTPGAGTYFVDVLSASLPNDIEIRALGTQDDGFQFSYQSNPYYNGQVLPQFRSQYNADPNAYLNVGDKSINDQAWQGILQTIKEQFLQQFGVQGVDIVEGLVDLMIQSLVPDTVGGIGQVVKDLNSTTRSFTESDWQNIQDITKLKPVTTYNYEVGYKGLILQSLGLSIDAYYTQYKDYIAPVTFVTPAVLFNSEEMMQYLTPILTENLNAPQNQLFDELLKTLLDNNTSLGGNGNGTASDELSSLIKQAVDNLPIGVITPTKANGPDMLLVSRNIGDVNVFGVDCGAQFYFSKFGKVFANYSWVNKDSIRVPGAQFGYVALNAPKHRLNVGANYNFEKIGLTVGAGFKWQAGFPVSSGNFVGRVKPFHDMDVNLSWTPTFLKQFNATFSMQNIYNNKFQYFIGSPTIGSMALLRLSYAFEG